MTNPATIALNAINSPGNVNTNFTKADAFGKDEKALVISGREAEMVIMDMMVRLLTNKMVAFTCQLSVFIIQV